MYNATRITVQKWHLNSIYWFFFFKQIYIKECLVSIDQISKIENVKDIAKAISFVSNAVFPCEKVDGVQKYDLLFLGLY